MTTAFTPSAKAAVFIAQIARWHEYLPVLRAPRILEEMRLAEESRCRPRRAVMDALRKAHMQAWHLADVRSYRHLTSKDPLPLAYSDMEFEGGRPSRTPFFYRRQAICWARHARRKDLLTREECLSLAKDYLAQYRKACGQWSAKFGTAA